MQEKQLQKLPINHFTLNDPFWNPYGMLVNDVLLPYQWELINDRVEDATKSYCIQNFRIAAGEEKGEHQGNVFQDTDLAKWLEAVAFSLGQKPNPELEKLADEAIALVGRAQRADGYLNTYYTLHPEIPRWSDLFEGHELYTAGHFMEAAVAYYRTTGKRSLLDMMCRFADYLCQVFGTGEGQIKGYPGHQEVEVGLYKLFEVTGVQKYLDLAYYFITQRGQEPSYFRQEDCFVNQNFIFPEFQDFDLDYCQAHVPVDKQKTAEGHAVRALYMYSAMADLAFARQDEKLLQICKTLFDNVTQKRMYITGSIGSASYGERFTTDYDLPNDSNYSETCATIALAMFSQRMFRNTRDGRYMDVAERALYNTLLSGIALDGEHFFYVNPLEVIPEVTEKNPSYRHVKTQRQRWFGCACCPTNIARTLTSLSDYAFSAEENALYVNLFLAGQVKSLDGELICRIDARYPYHGDIRLTIEQAADAEFTLSLRVPAFSAGQFKLSLNGEKLGVNCKNGYVYVTRRWQKGDVLTLLLDVTPRFVYSNPCVRENLGKTAIMKGPVVYCMEEIDNFPRLSAARIDTEAPITEAHSPNLPEGTTVLCVKGSMLEDAAFAQDLPLYISKPGKEKAVTLTAIPYCLWNNRGKGEMLVWMRY